MMTTTLCVFFVFCFVQSVFCFKVKCPVYVLSKLRPTIQIRHSLKQNEWQDIQTQLRLASETPSGKLKHRLDQVILALIKRNHLKQKQENELSSEASAMKQFYSPQKYIPPIGVRRDERSALIENLYDAEANLRRSVVRTLNYIVKEKNPMYAKDFQKAGYTLVKMVCSTDDPGAKSALENGNLNGWTAYQDSTEFRPIIFSRAVGRNFDP